MPHPNGGEMPSFAPESPTLPASPFRPMSSTPLRRTLGRLKFKALDCWPYIFAERRAAIIRRAWRPQAGNLPPLPASGPFAVDVLMACGKADLDMGIVASWSLLRFLPGATLHVFSDGTLDEVDFAIWRKVVPNATLVSRSEVIARLSQAIASRYPRLHDWSRRVACDTQTVGAHLFGRSDKIITMAADVLCFRRPDALLADLSASGPIHRWSRDARASYSAGPKMLKSITGLELPDALNAGFQMTSRHTGREFGHLEKMLEAIEEDGRVDPHHSWSSQTYCALCAAISPNAKAWPDTYSVTLGTTSDQAVVRPYVGIPRVRPRFFTEGLPRLVD